jgi:hypothetical protein
MRKRSITARKQFEDELVSRWLRNLDADCGQMVNIEKAPLLISSAAVPM